MTRQGGWRNVSQKLPGQIRGRKRPNRSGWRSNRPATEEEIAEGVELMNRLTRHRKQKPAEALRYWCLTVLNLNEFVYLD